jgi:hypothetical protein
MTSLETLQKNVPSIFRGTLTCASLKTPIFEAVLLNDSKYCIFRGTSMKRLNNFQRHVHKCLKIYLFLEEIIAWLVTKFTRDEHFSHKTSEEESASHSGLFYEQTGHSRHDTVSQDDMAR